MVLEQFVPSSVCMRCDVCCRFSEKASCWRPRVGAGEQAGFAENAALRSAYDGAVGPEGYLRTEPRDGQHQCLFFQPDDGQTCRIYPERPFECRVYPFLLTRHGDEYGVSLHLVCPFAQEHFGTPKLERYAAYLRQFFLQPDVREFLKSNLSVFGDYSAWADQYARVFPLTFFS